MEGNPRDGAPGHNNAGIANLIFSQIFVHFADMSGFAALVWRCKE
jgi:hypothetical protein